MAGWAWGWHTAWVWQLSHYISLWMQALITGRLDRFDTRQLTLGDSCLRTRDTGLESESWLINIQLWPVFLSILVFVRSKHHMQRQQIAVQRIVLSFWKPQESLAPANDLYVHVQVHNRHHILQRLCKWACKWTCVWVYSLLSVSDKAQLPFKINTTITGIAWNFNQYYNRLCLTVHNHYISRNVK